MLGLIALDEAPKGYDNGTPPDNLLSKKHVLLPTRKRRDDSQAPHQSPDGAPGGPAPVPRPGANELAENGPSEVKTEPCLY